MINNGTSNFYYETFKYFAPLLVFALGVYLSPYIELRKNKSKEEKNKLRLAEEFKDEIEQLKISIIKLFEAIDVQTSLINKNYEAYLNENNIGKASFYVPGTISFIFIDDVLSSHYIDINSKHRKLLKSIKRTEKGFNDAIEKARKVDRDDPEQVVNELKACIQVCALLRNFLQLYFLDLKILDVNGSTDKAFLNQIKDLNLNKELNDFYIMKTKKYDV